MKLSHDHHPIIKRYLNTLRQCMILWMHRKVFFKMILNFRKSIVELESNASMWWPSELAEMEHTTSILPLLLKSQDKFISILKLCNKTPFQIFDLIKAADFPGNLFLKHLVVLTDFGGEQIQRLNSQFYGVFPKGTDGKITFGFAWKENNYSYAFKKLPLRGTLNNPKMAIDGPGLLQTTPIDDIKQDMIMILLFGSTADNEATATTLCKCEIGTLLGENAALDKYIKEKYLWVSRITGGAQSNTLGQIAQTYVVDYLRKNLGPLYSIRRNSQISISGQNYPFDIVVTRGKTSIGIEVSFQVTTNSTIERKASHADSIQKQLHDKGHYVAYIIDGAGNFQRKSAISKICNHSDCTVAYSDQEFDILVKFINSKLP